MGGRWSEKASFYLASLLLCLCGWSLLLEGGKGSMKRSVVQEALQLTGEGTFCV